MGEDKGIRTFLFDSVSFLKDNVSLPDSVSGTWVIC